jgi:hypothetical protein
MGATLAARQIERNGLANRVDAFVGIAGAFRGLWSCGTYPYNVWSSTCGYWGLSVNSPFLNGLKGKRFGGRVYSLKSWSDQVVCATGVCTVGGIHSPQACANFVMIFPGQQLLPCLQSCASMRARCSRTLTRVPWVMYSRPPFVRAFRREH